MKKLAVLMMIPALAMFMVPALASADDHGHGGAGHGIHGLYAVTGFSTCNPIGPAILEGDYTFNGDGTGSAQGGFVRSTTRKPTGNPSVGTPRVCNLHRRLWVRRYTRWPHNIYVPPVSW